VGAGRRHGGDWGGESHASLVFFAHPIKKEEYELFSIKSVRTYGSLQLVQLQPEHSMLNVSPLLGKLCFSPLYARAPCTLETTGSTVFITASETSWHFRVKVRTRTENEFRRDGDVSSLSGHADREDTSSFKKEQEALNWPSIVVQASTHQRSTIAMGLENQSEANECLSLLQ